MVGVVSPRPERQVEILHVVPGRLRLRVLGKEPGTVLRAVIPHLRKQDGVREIRTNEQIGSLLITFDTNQLSLGQLFESLGTLGITEIKPPQSQESFDSEAWKKAGTQLQSFIPLLIGLLTTRQLGIQGWQSIPVYLLTVNVVRQIMQSLDWVAEKAEEKAEGRGQNAEGNNTNLNGYDLSQTTPSYEQNGKSPTVSNGNSTVTYSLVHAVPGRIRFRVPKVADDSAYLRRLQLLVKKDDWITQMRCNSTAASVVMTYNPMEIGEAEAGLHGISLIQMAANPDARDVETCHASLGTSPGTSGNQVVGAGFSDTIPETTHNLTQPTQQEEPEKGEEIAAEANSLTPPVQGEEEKQRSEDLSEGSVEPDLQPANTDDLIADEPEQMEDCKSAIATSVSPWLEFKSAALSTILRLMAKTPVVGA